MKKYKVCCLGLDGKFRTEFFNTMEEAKSVVNWIKGFYGNPNVKAMEVNEDEDEDEEI